jgi:hypothetical protein
MVRETAGTRGGEESVRSGPLNSPTNGIDVTAPCILVVALLTVQSSYLRNVEQPRDTVPDTIQFWFSPESDWRIKSFAIDHDIHVHKIRTRGAERTFGVEQAAASTEKNYGNVLDRLLVIEIANPADSEAVTALLRSHGLGSSLETDTSGVSFYNPDGRRYRSQSNPE